ncbi:MAG: DUF433 domain-containing protein [Anaerolineae bacterium]
MAEQTIPTTIDLRKYIDRSKFGGRPHIRGRRLPVSYLVADYHTQGWSVSRLAEEYTLSEAEVFAALLYYEEHKTEIDAQDKDEARLFDEMSSHSHD